MVRCIDCSRYPWKVDADPAMLPPAFCPVSRQRRWTKESMKMEHNCPQFRTVVIEEKKPEQLSPDDYTINELRAKAKELGLKNVSRLSKDKITSVINAALRGDAIETNG